MTIKIVMIYDQIRAGIGTKDDRMVPLGIIKEPVGPAVMMESFLKEIDGRVMACLYCGHGTYQADPGEVSRKLCAMVGKIRPDLVICGPAFDNAAYGEMAARVAADIRGTTDIPVLAAMAAENAESIRAFKDKVPIVVMPKRGGVGLHDALHNLCRLAKAMANKEPAEELMQAYCF